MYKITNLLAYTIGIDVVDCCLLLPDEVIRCVGITQQLSKESTEVSKNDPREGSKSKESKESRRSK